MASTYTNLGVELMATGENAGTWGTKTNANLNLAEQLLGGFKIQTLNAAGTGANTTALAVDDGALTGAAQNRVIILGAVSPQAITGNKIVTFPLLTETFYFIKNSTSGAYTVQLKAVSGSGATVTFSATDKGYKIIYLDGVATNTGVIEVPLGDANEVTLTGTQTLTNKTLTDPILSPAAATAGKIEFLEGTNNGTNKATLIGPASTADVTVTLPASTDTLVGKATTDTLTNKTLTSPKVNEDVVVSSTATELNLLDGATVTTAEINYSDLATLGTSAASKVLTANANNLTTISGAVLNTEDTLSDSSTISWNVINSPVAKVTLAGNRTMAAPSGTGTAAGQMISLLAIQDGTGSRTITWNAVYEFPSDTAPTLTTTANLGDIFSFRYNGSKWLLIGQTLALTLS